MAIIFENQLAHIVQFSIEIAQLPEVLALAIQGAPNTPEIEAAGQALIDADFNDQMAVEFVYSVCVWGNYAGVYGNVVANNTAAEISAAMRGAHQETVNGDHGQALETVLALHGLGVSFATKHLKFLNPVQHVVLDSVIRDSLGYPLTTQGYLAFRSDCEVIRDSLIAQELHRHDDQPFRIADVEMAIYRICQGN